MRTATAHGWMGSARLLAAACGGALLLSAASVATQAEDAAGSFTEAETKQIETIIGEFLMKNPEVVLEALRSLEERQRVAEAEQRKQALVENRAALTEDPLAPVMGNPEGDVVVVEFFDYQCGYCKQMFQPLMDEVNRDGQVKLVMKEFPILGPVSVVAAKAALAAREQDKYSEFHVALMGLQGKLSEDSVYTVAESVGLDLGRLKVDMESDEVGEMLRANYDLSEQLDIRGTPAFVIGDEVVPGAISKESLAEMIAKARDRSS